MNNCECVYNNQGECRLNPPVNVIEFGKVAWKFPPATSECGQKREPLPEWAGEQPEQMKVKRKRKKKEEEKPQE